MTQTSTSPIEITTPDAASILNAATDERARPAGITTFYAASGSVANVSALTLTIGESEEAEIQFGATFDSDTLPDETFTRILAYLAETFLTAALGEPSGPSADNIEDTWTIYPGTPPFILTYSDDCSSSFILGYLTESGIIEINNDIAPEHIPAWTVQELPDLREHCRRIDIGKDYEQQVGYNPFEDDPTLSTNEVAETLAQVRELANSATATPDAPNRHVILDQFIDTLRSIVHKQLADGTDHGDPLAQVRAACDHLQAEFAKQRTSRN